MLKKEIRSRSLMYLVLSLYKIYFYIPHLFAKITRRYYHEDYLRVYPDGVAYYAFGLKRRATKRDRKNFLSHIKFYNFVTQFVKGKKIVDIGCGSGYGCKIIKEAGAELVHGCDASVHSINFAKSRYSKFANFTVQTVTDLNKYKSDMFDISVSSEVLEHVKEYNMQNKTLEEIKRVTGSGGLVIIGTPNVEVVEQHGYTFDEIDFLIKNHFNKYCIFENALIPYHNNEFLWKDRLLKGKTGVIISQNIDKKEIAFFERGVKPKFKAGIKTGKFRFANIQINTDLLQNTHSWVIIAINNK